MARSDNNLKAVLQDTANAIRAKTGASEPIVPRDFADEIENMPTGGGDDVAIIERTISGVYSNTQISVVGSCAFACCSELTKVNLPNVTSIGNHAFSGCSQLEEANLPNVTSIGSYAFSNCSSLKRAIFPKCSDLGGGPFANCTNIEEMSFDSLTKISTLLASGCSSTLTTIYFPNVSMITAGAFPNCSLISEFIFSKCVLVGYGAFSGARIYSKPYSFPEALFLNTYAFADCSISDYINFPKCICINQYAISGNVYTKGLSFPECRVIKTNLMYNWGWAVSSSQHFDQFYFPKLRFVIDNNSPFFIQSSNNFFLSSMLELPNCYIANGVSRPDSLFVSLPKALEIAGFEFDGRGGIYCPNVFWILGFNNVSHYSSETFEMKNLCFISGGWNPIDSSTANMKVINFPILYSASCGALVQSAPNLEVLNIPNLKSYSNGFTYNKKLSSLVLHNMPRINNQMVQYCSSLESFYLFNASTVAVPLNNINAFQNTPMSVESYLGRFGSIYVHPSRVALYQGATNWATYAARITAATSEMLNSGIWNWEFAGRTDLTEVPSERLNAKNIGDGAFSGCTNLGSVNLSECLFIGASAFSNCSSLSQINTPKVQFIDSCAFMANSKIENIDFPSCLFVGPSAFHSCPNLSSANLPLCVRISNNAFYNCQSLVSVQLGNCLSISQSAFAFCYSLSAIKAPQCVLIGTSAFAYCSNLSEAFLPYCVSIYNNAFYSCSSLRRLLIPFIDRIYSNAFYNCKNLESVYLFSTASIYMDGDVFANTPLSNSTYLGHYGSIFVKASLVEVIKAIMPFAYLRDRIVGLTDEEIASVYSSFGYNVEDF